MATRRSSATPAPSARRAKPTSRSDSPKKTASQAQARVSSKTFWQRLESAEVWPLRWATDERTFGAAAFARMQVWDHLRRTRPGKSQDAESLVRGWLESAHSAAASPAFALECLAAAHVLPSLTETLSAELATAALDFLIQTAHEAAHSRSESDWLTDQLAGGELPLTLAGNFPEIQQRSQFLTAAQQRLSQGIVEAVDGDGIPHRRHLAVIRLLWACWTRCGHLALSAGFECLSGDAPLHFEWFTRRCLQLTRSDGRQVLGGDAAPAGDRGLVEAALALGDDRDNATIAGLVWPDRKRPAKKSENPGWPPDSTAHSEWAQLTILRPNWTSGGEHLAVAWGDAALTSELNWGEVTLWSGDWTPQIAIDGRPAKVTSDWEEVCWSSSDDVDYLELEVGLSGGWRLQRQIVLAREDHFLYIGDAVLGPKTAEIDYRGSLPLTDQVGFYPADDSHEGTLVGGPRRALVLPLALPEWRTARGSGRLAISGRGTQLQQQVTAARLYAPLFIDLNPKRAKLPFTWRRLTIGEKLQILGDDVAVGYRVQIGGEQWLFYRSLAPAASRTVLGQNLTHEFIAARFDCEGEAEELISITAAP